MLRTSLFVLALSCGFIATSVYMFTRGFLLSRVALSETATACTTDSPLCWKPPHQPYKRVIVLLIDALRFDFTTWRDASEPRHYQNKLSVLHQLEAHNNETHHRAFLYRFVADPPTTTLQRLKAMTTGTLPTFVDAGDNFGGSQVNEDAWVTQWKGIQSACSASVMMGDDTWMSLYPTAFTHTYPYPSLNVWDLHTVDDGILLHLPDYLQDDACWSLLLGHFLGVDHCGHRFGPDHSEMASKLTQMNTLIDSIVNNYIKRHPDTLLLVFGDHGMDGKGNHGGDSRAEVGSALFVYSGIPIPRNKHHVRLLDTLNDKQHILDLLQRIQQNQGVTLDVDMDAIESLKPYYSPSDRRTDRWRNVPQIDLVPTLSLLFQLPIPFSNLGSIIPELFIDTDKDIATMVHAMRANAHQMSRYVDEYVKHQAVEEISAPLVTSWKAVLNQADHAFHQQDHTDAYVLYALYCRQVLNECKRIWAQFDMALISFGLVALAAALVHAIQAARLVFAGAEHGRVVMRSITAGMVGAVVMVVLRRVFVKAMEAFAVHTVPSIWYQVAFGSVVGASLGLLSFQCPSTPSTPSTASAYTFGDGFIATVIILLHCLVFLSNSMVVHEDAIVQGLLQTFALVYMVRVLRIPSKEKFDTLKHRFLVYAAAFMVLTKFSAYFTVCREEQLPTCTPTFYESPESTTASNAQLIALVSLPVLVPNVLQRVLKQTKSYHGVAFVWISFGLRLVLFLSAFYWIMDEQQAQFLGKEWTKWLMLMCIRTAFALCLIGFPYVWWSSPLCVDLQRATTPTNPQTVANQTAGKPVLVVLGYANMYGSSYLVLLTALYAVLAMVQQPSGALVTTLALLHVVCVLEMQDAWHDLTQQTASHASTSIVFAMLALHYYFHTGHQATLVSIQWRAGFVGLDQVSYLVSPLLVVLNHVGPYILFACAAPLIALWKQPPQIQSNGVTTLSNRVLHVLLTYITVHGLVLFMSMFWGAYFRRHLMVWKIWAPRFMLAASSSLIAILLLVVSTCIAHRVITQVKATFQTEIKP